MNFDDIKNKAENLLHDHRIRSMTAREGFGPSRTRSTLDQVEQAEGFPRTSSAIQSPKPVSGGYCQATTG